MLQMIHIFLHIAVTIYSILYELLFIQLFSDDKALLIITSPFLRVSRLRQSQVYHRFRQMVIHGMAKLCQIASPVQSRLNQQSGLGFF